MQDLKDYSEELTITAKESMDFSTLLTALGAEFTINGHYWQVLRPKAGKGWLLDISATIDMANETILNVVPILIKENIPFKVVRDTELGQAASLGVLGVYDMGKVISAFPENETDALRIASILVEVTKIYRGPAIVGDFFLGGTVYTRYGGFITGEVVDETGISSRCYVDIDGNYVPEDIADPFEIPEKLKWPFGSIKQYISTPESDTIGAYKILKLLKNDLKGKVILAESVGKNASYKLVVIKEGLPGRGADIHGRDIRDKLAFQYKHSQELKDKIPIAQPIDFLKIGERVYFVQEYLEGRTLGEEVDERGSMHWCAMPYKRKIQFAGYALSIISIDKEMTKQGYYHRDIHSRNFQITEEDIFGFDLEMVYNKNTKQPDPPFISGAAGYASPEQRKDLPPEPSQDVYAIGGILIKVFSGLSPKLFDTQNIELLFAHLSWLTGSESLASLIVNCMDIRPSERPTLEVVESSVKKYIHTEALKKAVDQIGNKSDHSKINEIINSGIRALASDRFTIPSGHWITRPAYKNNSIANSREETTILYGMQKGLAGILYFLASAEVLGYDTAVCGEKRVKNWQLVHQQRFLSTGIMSGLYSGTPGICVAFSKGVQSGKITQPEEMRSFFDTCFPDTDDLTISTGLAGHGVALLQCKDILSIGVADSMLSKITETLLKKQNRDGSWSILKNDFDKPYNLGSFSNGSAGIALFLIENYKATGYQKSLDAALRALNFLDRKCHKHKGARHTWLHYPEGPPTNAWLTDGVAGYLLPIIRAYGITKEKKLKDLAESSLFEFEPYLVPAHLDVLTGAAGVGELYLEAANIFKDGEWQTRADWITQMLLHRYQRTEEGAVYWVTDNTTLATPDLLQGTSGILQFLIHHQHPDKTPFQIFR